jgi:hypothetical protein
MIKIFQEFYDHKLDLEKLSWRIPGKPFRCKRGVWQGDPLSPLLFVEGADLLQSLVNKAFENGVLSAPIPITTKYPIIHYADDTIIFLPIVQSDLEKFKEILQQYVVFSGLKVNYHKSSIISINQIEEEATTMAAIFECQLASMSFTYLGLPMGTTKPSIRDLSPLIDRVERRFSSTASFLSYGDRLVLVNSVMYYLPTYTMLTLMIPVGVLEVLDRARRHCLWRRKDKEKINSLASWYMVCKPKKQGGLGIFLVEKCFLSCRCLQSYHQM